MRIVMPKRESELIEKITPYLYCPKGKHGMFLRDDAPDDVKKAFEEVKKLPPLNNPDMI
jgi:hypothetical protein